MDCCFLINFEFMWCYVFILWFYLSFFGLCVRVAGLRVQAAVTQLICFYVASIKKGFITVLSFFHLLWAVEKFSRMIICVKHI